MNDEIKTAKELQRLFKVHLKAEDDVRRFAIKTLEEMDSNFNSISNSAATLYMWANDSLRNVHWAKEVGE